jgi:hypothetical protein
MWPRLGGFGAFGIGAAGRHGANALDRLGPLARLRMLRSRAAPVCSDGSTRIPTTRQPRDTVVAMAGFTNGLGRLVLAPSPSGTQLLPRL